MNSPQSHPYVLTHLRECTEYINKLVSEIQRRGLDNISSVELGSDMHHILTHLLMAWHTRFMGPAELAQLDTRDRELIMNAIPRFSENMSIVSQDWTLADGAD